MVALVFAHFVDRNDVRVAQIPGGFRLRQESSDLRHGSEMAGEDHLERHHAVETDLACPIDDPHAAPGDLAEQFVILELLRPGVARRPWQIHTRDDHRFFRRRFQLVQRPRISSPAKQTRRAWLFRGSAR